MNINIKHTFFSDLRAKSHQNLVSFFYMIETGFIYKRHCTLNGTTQRRVESKNLLASNFISHIAGKAKKNIVSRHSVLLYPSIFETLGIQ